MRPEDLMGLSQAALADYVWRRLRLEGVMDPPLNRRFRLEPPEDFLLSAVRAVNVFRPKLVDAVKDNLRRLTLALVENPIGNTDAKQLASLSFLVSALEEKSLAKNLYNLALAIGGDHSDLSPDGILALFHVLRSIAELNNDEPLVPFWQDIATHSKYPNIRAIAYYGLIRADARQLEAALARILDDDEIDQPTLVWRLASEPWGIIPLANAAATLSQDLKRKMADVLRAAGASEAMLAEFAMHCDGNNSDFPFEVPEPNDWWLAHQMPRLAA